LRRTEARGDSRPEFIYNKNTMKSRPVVSSPAPPEVPFDPRRFAVVLVRPETPENIGLAARGMANTGFSDLRLVGVTGLAAAAYRTAVHAEPILDGARFAATLDEALSDRHLVLASTARARGQAGLVTLGDAVGRLSSYPPETRVALVFGNERTGLSAAELGLANIRFRISQAARQPSYNLGVAVTLTLFALASSAGEPPPPVRERPLVYTEQEDAVRRFRDLLDGLGFMKETNRGFISGRVEDIFRRMTLTAKDRDIILAMFRQALARGAGKRPGAPGRPGPRTARKGETYGE